MDRKDEIVQLTSAQLDQVSGGLDFSPLAAAALAAALKRTPKLKILTEPMERETQVVQKL